MEYIVLLIALAAIIWSADTLVAGAVDVARRLWNELDEFLITKDRGRSYALIPRFADF